MNVRAVLAPRWFGLAAWLTPVIFFAIAPVAFLVGKSLRALDASVAASLISELDALGNTLLTSLGAAAFAFLLATPLALLLYRTDVPLRGMFAALFTLPSAIPPFIWGMGWLLLANPKAGYLNRLFGERTFDIYGPAGIAFVMGLSGIPLVLLAGGSALRRIDPGLEEAARVCGASPLRALLATTVPLALPSLLSGAVMVFLMAASAFGVPYILGVSASPPTQVLTTRIYGYVLMGGDDNLARAVLLATTLLAMTPLVLWLNRAFGKMGRVRLGAGKGVSPRPMSLGRGRIPALLFVAAAAGVLVLLPLGAVALTSVQRSFGAALTAENFTLSHWSHLFGDTRTLYAAGRSIVLALAAGGVVVVLG
ncbi:MAG: ABC transporter permease subunit, partial [Myxococcaceae bacterium]